jgi:DNA repair protein RAD7
MDTLVSACKNLKKLRLKEVGKMSDKLLESLGNMKGGLTYLDLSYPGRSDALSEDALITLMERVGPTLVHLDLSNNKNLTHRFLSEGVEPYVHCLESFVLANLDELTDEGVGRFFDNWATSGSNPALKSLDLSRNHELSSAALKAVLKHSSSRLTSLNINGWKSTPEDSLNMIPQQAKHLVRLDFGFCRGVNDFLIKALLEECDSLKEIKCWGCNGVSVACPRKVGVRYPYRTLCWTYAAICLQKNINIIGVQSWNAP